MVLGSNLPEICSKKGMMYSNFVSIITSFLGYRTQFKLIKFNSVLIVPNSLKKRHFEPQKPLEMAMKPHSAVLNVKFYYYS